MYGILHQVELETH